MTVRHTPSDLVTSSAPVLHCCETWHALAREGRVLQNRPFHLSWAPEPAGQVVEMWTTAAGHLMPKVVVKGRGG